MIGVVGKVNTIAADVVTATSGAVATNVGVHSMITTVVAKRMFIGVQPGQLPCHTRLELGRT